MRALRRLASSWCCSALVGCGSAQKPPPPPLAAITEAEAPPAERRPYAETTPTLRGAPPSPPLWLRLGGPNGTLGKLPSVAQDMPVLAPLTQLDNQASSPYGSAVAAVIDLSQPVDVALDLPTFWFLDLKPTWSFRVRSPDAVLRGNAGLTLQRVSAGVWNVALPPPVEPEIDPDAGEGDEAEYEEEEEEETEDVEASGPACQLRHAPDPVGYRMICGSTLERVNRDAPFLAAPERDQGRAADVHAELGGPDYKKLTEQRHRYFDIANTASVDSTDRMMVKMMSDVGKAVLQHDQLAFDAELTGERLLGQMELRFLPQPDSPLLQGWLEQASRTPLPASCARLPRDGAFTACFSGVGNDVVQSFVEQFMGSLNEDVQLRARDSAEISSALSGILPSAGHVSMTCGVDAEAALRALGAPAVANADEAERALSPAAVASLNEALGGWCAFGVDTAPHDYLAAAQRVYRADKIKTTRKAPEINPQSHSTLKIGAALAGMPAKTAHYVSQTRPDPKYKPESPFSPPPTLPYDMHLVLVPDGERVWIVTSRSEKLAAARAKALLSPSATTPWPELATFTGKPGLGFFAIDFAAFEAFDIEWDSLRQRKVARSKLQSVIITSGKARDLVPFWLDVVPRQGAPGHNLRLRTDFPLLRVLGDLAVDVPEQD